MNIFFLHIDPKVSVKYYFNKHCVKIILEICQMLYTAHWCGRILDVWIIRHREEMNGLEPYRKTHFNHPTAKWVRQSKANYLYTVQMGLELCYEYTRRYGKIHKCQVRLEWLQNNIPPMNIGDKIDAYLATSSVPKGCTPVPLAMPDEYKCPDLIESYRKYYLGSKAELQDKTVTVDYLREVWQFLI